MYNNIITIYNTGKVMNEKQKENNNKQKKSDSFIKYLCILYLVYILSLMEHIICWCQK